MAMLCSYSKRSNYKGVVLKYILYVTLTFLLLSGCAQKKPYSYPNYDIIKPEKVCKPNRENIQELLLSYLGKPYVWAEEGPDAFDCSGLTYNIYGKMGVEIPRTASEQAKMGRHIPFQELEYGDLIFFGTTNRRSQYISHVGIYLGENWFAHASSKDRKVTVSNFEIETIYKRRLKICRRYLSIDERQKYMTCSTPLKKMKITTDSYTTPWKVGMSLPKRAVPRKRRSRRHHKG